MTGDGHVQSGSHDPHTFPEILSTLTRYNEVERVRAQFSRENASLTPKKSAVQVCQDALQALQQTKIKSLCHWFKSNYAIQNFAYRTVGSAKEI